MKRYSTFINILIYLLSIIIESVLLFFIVLNKTGSISTKYTLLLLIIIILSVPIYSYVFMTKQSKTFYDTLLRISLSWCMMFCAIVTIAFITKNGQFYSREVVFTWFIFSYILQVFVVAIYFKIKRRRLDTSMIQNAIIVVANMNYVEFATKIQNNPRIKLIGIIAESNELKIDLNIKKLGNNSDIVNIINEHNIHIVYLLYSAQELTSLDSISFTLLETSAEVIWVCDTRIINLLNNPYYEFEGEHMTRLNLPESQNNIIALFWKRLFDILFSTFMIVVLTPLLLLISIIIKFTSTGNVIFKQRRHGLNAREFNIYKFRSMYYHKDKKVVQAKRDDQRITGIGHFLRKTSLDELPQLFNVLKGEMSIVGPRPHAIEHNSFYSKQITKYMARHRVKPGITGLAQINGARGETETVEKMLRRVEFDLQYINNWTPWYDIKITFLTPFKLFSKDIY